MIKTVIHIVSAPFSKRDYDRFGVDILQKRGFNVFIWNLVEILYPNAAKEIINPDPIIWQNLVHVKNIAQLKDMAEKIDDSIFIYTTLSFNLKTLKIFKIIFTKGIPYCVSSLNAAPVSILSNNSLEKNVIRIRIMISYWVKIFIMKLFKINSATFVTKLGLLASIERPEVSRKTKCVGIHSHDYDLFISNQNKNLQSDKFAVFLDNYLPYHPDSLYSGEKNPISADLYHNSINKLFDEIEKHSKLKVVIAAHPRSNYSKDFNPFDQREVINNKSAELVKHAELVILSWSSSINFAVLYNKPCFFFTTNELENSIYRSHIKEFCSLFNRTPVNIDKDFKLGDELIFNYDLNSYENYKFNYIKMPGTDNIPVWEIIASEIETINKN